MADEKKGMAALLLAAPRKGPADPEKEPMTEEDPEGAEAPFDDACSEMMDAAKKGDMAMFKDAFRAAFMFLDRQEDKDDEAGE